MTDPIELLTVPEVADELGLSETHIYRLIHSNDLAHVKVGKRRYLISREQLNDFIAARTVRMAEP